MAIIQLKERLKTETFGGSWDEFNFLFRKLVQATLFDMSIDFYCDLVALLGFIVMVMQSNQSFLNMKLFDSKY